MFVITNGKLATWSVAEVDFLATRMTNEAP
jgi:hypothetical protein